MGVNVHFDAKMLSDYAEDIFFNPNPAELTTERTENTEDDLFMIRCV